MSNELNEAIAYLKEAFLFHSFLPGGGGGSGRHTKEITPREEELPQWDFLADGTMILNGHGTLDIQVAEGRKVSIELREDGLVTLKSRAIDANSTT